MVEKRSGLARARGQLEASWFIQVDDSPLGTNCCLQSLTDVAFSDRSPRALSHDSGTGHSIFVLPYLDSGPPNQIDTCAGHIVPSWNNCLASKQSTRRVQKGVSATAMKYWVLISFPLSRGTE